MEQDMIYGMKAQACRSEMLKIRQRHHQLCAKLSRTAEGTPEHAALQAEIEQNIQHLDEIETRYFGLRGGECAQQRPLSLLDGLFQWRRSPTLQWLRTWIRGGGPE